MPGLTREQIEPVDASQPGRRRAGDAAAARGRALAGRVGGARARRSAPPTTSARCSSAAWAAARSAATSPPPCSAIACCAPLHTVRGYELPSWATPELGRPVRQLLGQHRGDACLLRGGRRAGRDRDRGHDRRPLADAARDDGVPVIPLPAGLQPRAAVAYMLVSALEVAALSRRRACTSAPRSTRPRRRSSSWRASWGPDADSDSLAKRVAQRVHKTLRVRLRRRADRADRDALEDPDQREREGAGLLRRSCPRPTTTRSCGWEGAAVAGQLHGGVPGGLRPAPARAPAHRADRRA